MVSTPVWPPAGVRAIRATSLTLARAAQYDRGPWRRNHGRVLSNQAAPALRLRDRQRPEVEGARQGRGHHRPRDGQSRPGDAQAHRQQAGRGGPQSAQPPLLGLQGDHPAAEGGHELVPHPLRGRAGRGDRGNRHHRGQGGHGPPGPCGAPAGGRGAGPQPDLSHPLLLGGDRRRRPALGAAHPGRRLLRPAAGDGPARLAQGQAPDPLLPAQPDDALRGPRVLRQGRRLRARAPADGGARLRLRRFRLRRLQAPVLPGGAGGQGRGGRDLLAVEVLQHAGLAGGLRVRELPDGQRAGPHQVVPRLRRLPAHPDRGDHRARGRAGLRGRHRRAAPKAPRRPRRRPQQDRLVRPQAQGHHVRVGPDPGGLPQHGLARVLQAAHTGFPGGRPPGRPRMDP